MTQKKRRLEFSYTSLFANKLVSSIQSPIIKRATITDIILRHLIANNTHNKAGIF